MDEYGDARAVSHWISLILSLCSDGFAREWRLGSGGVISCWRQSSYLCWRSVIWSGRGGGVVVLMKNTTASYILLLVALACSDDSHLRLQYLLFKLMFDYYYYAFTNNTTSAHIAVHIASITFWTNIYLDRNIPSQRSSSNLRSIRPAHTHVSRLGNTKTHYFRAVISLPSITSSIDSPTPHTMLSCVVRSQIKGSSLITARSFRTAKPTTMPDGPFFSHTPRFRRGPRILTSSVLRRAFSSGPRHNASQSAVKSITWIFLGINTAVFAAWQYADSDMKLKRWLFENAILSEQNFRAGRYHTLITSAFSHRELSHFAFNMITLYAFCSFISTVPGFGAMHMIGLAFGSALASSGASLWHWRQMAPKPAAKRGWLSRLTTHERPSVTVIHQGLGASGLVQGCGAVAAMLMPTASVYLMFIPIPVPLWIATAGFVAYDTYRLNSNSRVGHAAHLGGFFFGAAYYLVALRSRGGVWQLLRKVFRR